LGEIDMHHRNASALAAAITAAWAAAAQPALADPPAAQPAAATTAPAADQAAAPAAQSATAQPQASTPPPADPAPQTAPEPAAASGPLVTYIKRTKPPYMIDMTIASAELGMIGAFAAISSGHEIVTKNDIADPSTEIARSVAQAYAASQGGRVADTPIPDDQLPARAKPEDVGQRAGGARYVVAVAPANMEVIYFVSDPLRRDITLLTAAEIIDTSSGKVVARARCFIKQAKEGERFTHDQLLADQATALKAVIVRKSHECVEKLETGMKIAPQPEPAPTS
jgi:hypothetical protein